MADVTISNLPQIAAANIVGTDVVIINDTSTNTTMKATINDLMRRGSKTLYLGFPENITLSDGTTTYTRVPITAYVSNSGLCGIYVHIVPTAIFTNSGSSATNLSLRLYSSETDTTLIALQSGLFISTQRCNGELINAPVITNTLFLQTNSTPLIVPANGSLTITGGLVGSGLLYNLTADPFWIES